ncbi:hypothetical protein ACFS5J_12350, partial [Flavobacterium chuncheonense]
FVIGSNSCLPKRIFIWLLLAFLRLLNYFFSLHYAAVNTGLHSAQVLGILAEKIRPEFFLTPFLLSLSLRFAPKMQARNR